MDQEKRVRKELSAKLEALEAPSILRYLDSYEHERLVTQDRVQELLLAEERSWIQLQLWEKEYLEKVSDSSDQAMTLFWQIDLGWRRYIFYTAILDPSLGTRQRCYAVIDTYFRSGIKPYSDEDYPLGAQLDHIVNFGNNYKSLLENWEANNELQDSLQAIETPIDTDIVVEMTKKYVKGVRQSSARVKAIHQKYMSENFSAELGPEDSDPSQGPRAHEAGSSSSSLSPSAAAPNGSSFTLAPSNGNGPAESEKKKGKRRRRDDDDEEEEEDEDDRYDTKETDRMEIDRAEDVERETSSESSQHRSILSSSLSQPVSPTHPTVNEENKPTLPRHPSPTITHPSDSRTSDIAEPLDNPIQVVENLANTLGSSRFPHLLSKPTFLTRVSQSPASSVKERSGSPFGGTPRRGLPAGIRSMAVQTQTKLAKARRSSEMHLMQERIKAESVERSLSVEVDQLQQMEIDRDEDRAQEELAEVEAAKREREKTQEVEEEQKRQLAASTSGILMPPPTNTSRSSAPNSSGEVAPLPSSAEKPSTLVEPSTVLSPPPPPRLESTTAGPIQTEKDAITPSGSSIEEDRPTQELGFPTAAQPGPPHESLADLLPTASPDTTVERNFYQSEESQGESQSQPEITSNPTQNKVPTLLATIVTNSQSSSSSSSSSQHYPRTLIPDTSASTNADPSPADSLSRPQVSDTTSLLDPGRASTSKSRELSVPPPSPARVLRRSARLSKSPAPPEPTGPNLSKQATKSITLDLPLDSSNEVPESQAFYTQAPLVDSQESANPASQLGAVAENPMEEDRTNSQDSSNLTYASYQVAATTTTTTGNGRHIRFFDSDDDFDSDNRQARSATREAFADNSANLDKGFGSFGSQDLSGGHSRKMSFGDLENRATEGAPAEEPLDLEDHDI